MIIDQTPPQTKSERLMAVGYELFCRHGIRRVSVEEICRQSGVSKMTFYKYFQNKTDIALRIMEYLYDQGFETVEQIWEDKGPFIDKLTRTMVWKKELMTRFSFEFVQDIINSSDPVLHAYLDRMKTRSMIFFENILNQAQERGEIRSDLSVPFLVAVIEGLQHMLDNERFLKLFDSPRDMQDQLFTLFYYGVLPRS